MGFRANLELSQVSLLKKVNFQFLLTPAEMVSELLDFHIGYLTYLMTSSISIFFEGGLFLRKKAKKTPLGIIRTKLRKWLTCYHILWTYMLFLVLSIQWEIVESLELLQTKMRKLHSMLFQSFGHHSWPPADFLRNLWEGEYSLQCYVCFVQGKINHGQVLYMNVTRV